MVPIPLRERWTLASAALRQRWASLSLLAQFMALTAVATLAVMGLVAHWVANRIAHGVVQAQAAVAAHYTDTFIEPYVQDLKFANHLSEANQRILDNLLQPQIVGKSIVGFRIWKGDTIVYSDRKDLIGRSFPSSPLRQRAWEGQIGVEYGALTGSEHDGVDASSVPMLEIYAPVHATGSSHVIALAETYEHSAALESELSRSRIGTWLLVGFATMHILGLQMVIVATGSQTIEDQRGALKRQIVDLERLLKENSDLRQRATEASGRVADMNDRYLRRIGADLHDGPVQHLGVAMLRLDALSDVIDEAESTATDEAREDIDVLRGTLRDAVRELRNISGGLGLPELDGLTPAAVLETVAKRHERRTGTAVRCDVGQLPQNVPTELKGCLYRFAQEGLTNAFRHARGNGQAIEATANDSEIEVRVIDTGSVEGKIAGVAGDAHQGLIGLRDRLESLGGTIDIVARPGGGTCLTARIPVRLQRAEAAHG